MSVPAYQMNTSPMGPGGGITPAPGIAGDVQTGIGAAGSIYSLINSIQMGNAAQQATAQANPFGGYRPAYGSQLMQLMQDPSSVANLPGYQFLLNQGTQAVARGAAGPGGSGYGSGQMNADLMKYGQGLADQFYQQQVATLSHLAGADITPANAAQTLAAQGGAAGSLGAGITGLQNTIGMLSKLFPGGTGQPGTDYGTPAAPMTYPSGGTMAGGTPDWLGWQGQQPDATAGGGVPSWGTGDGGDPGSIDLSGMFAGPPSTAGGVAATSPGGSGIGTGIGAAGDVMGVGMGLASGKPGAAAVSAASLASQYPNVFGLSSETAKGLGSAAGAGGNVLNIIQGLKTGGVSGYGQAGIGVASLATKGLSAAGALSSGTAAELTGALGYAAIPLSVYNLAKTWQSGATGADMLAAASTGASIGTAIMPGVGTLIGAGVGALAGGISSAFGPGRMDPENVNWDRYAAAASKNPQSVMGATPSQNFQALAGIFDARGSNIPFYQKFGRMGENQFTVAMTNQINSALRSGAISTTTPPQDIYAKVVQPWITSMGGSQGWQSTYTIGGAPEKGAIGDLLTNMIGQWQAGMLNAGTPVGVSGQTIQGLPTFGG